MAKYKIAEIVVQMKQEFVEYLAYLLKCNMDDEAVDVAMGILN